MTKTKVARLVVEPTGDRFLVRREKVKRESRGGILIPETVKEETIRGTVIVHVIAAGPGQVLPNGERRRSVDAVVGDRLLLDSVHDACWIEDPHNPGEQLHLIKAHDVLAVIR
jgi:co-chaperonin GroES (HSP10)